MEPQPIALPLSYDRHVWLTAFMICICFVFARIFRILLADIYQLYHMDVTIDGQSADQRLDRFLRKFCKQYPQVSLGEIYKWLRTGLVKVNGKRKKEDYRVQMWDVVSFMKFELWEHKPESAKPIKQHRKERINWDKITPRIIYEDKHRLVWNKPAGIVLHESNHHRQDLSMNDYLEEYCLWKGISDPTSTTFRPSFWYRLDKDTSGVLIAAKDYASLQYVNSVIRERKIDKRYKTIVVGQFPKTLRLDKALEKSFDKDSERAHVVVSKEWKASVTECKLDKMWFHPLLGKLSMVTVKIETGRMHQIRVHLADAGYPVLWDITYGNEAVNRKLAKQLKIKRQLLHCWRYEVTDPHTYKPLKFEAPIPEEFYSLIM